VIFACEGTGVEVDLGAGMLVDRAALTHDVERGSLDVVRRGLAAGMRRG